VVGERNVEFRLGLFHDHELQRSRRHRKRHLTSATQYEECSNSTAFKHRVYQQSAGNAKGSCW
jgi:hypothetical protein